MISEYLEVRRTTSYDGKTGRYDVMAKRYPGMCLGEIRWFGRWRQYTFFPYPDSVFNNECLRDIAEFLDELMAARRKA